MQKPGGALCQLLGGTCATPSHTRKLLSQLPFDPLLRFKLEKQPRTHIAGRKLRQLHFFFLSVFPFASSAWQQAKSSLFLASRPKSIFS